MKGETAFGIIAVTAFIFILVFTIAMGGVSGETATEPATQVPPEDSTQETPTATETVAVVQSLTPVAQTVQETPMAAPTATEDPVVGTWTYNQTFTEKLSLRPDGTGTLVTVPEDPTAPTIRQEIAWDYDPAIKVGQMRAYHLTAGEGDESVLYLDPKAGTISKNSQGTVLIYNLSP